MSLVTRKLTAFALAIAASCCACLASADEKPRGGDGIDFFERKIRPVLQESCYRCHSAQAKKPKASLRLDTWEGIAKGGDTGKAAVVPGKPEESLLITAIRYTDKDRPDHDALLMPPPEDEKSGKLSDNVIGDFEAWVRMGAPYPKEVVVDAASRRSASAQHWAFQIPREPVIPSVKQANWARTPIDSFILAKLEDKGLAPSSPADKRTLIRRASFDLIGLPPTPEEVAAFAADDSPGAFAKVVDRLLASPHYGERWGRYWLDVARYADTKGYVFEEERRYPYAYAYRDWVIDAFNANLPYDQFLVQQIAGDCLPDEKPQDLAAEGFITLGRRFLNVLPDIIDDRIDVVCRGTMALTVGCARCHDHKFDPIPTSDYYSLYAIFKNSPENPNPPLLGAPAQTAEYLAFEKKLKAGEAKLSEFRKTQYESLLPLIRSPKKVAEYLLAAELGGRTPSRDSKADGRPAPWLLKRWKQLLARAARENDGVFAVWRAYAALPNATFANDALAVMDRLLADEEHPINPLVADEFADLPPASLREAADRYAALFTSVDENSQTVGPDAEALRQVLHGPLSPVGVSLADVENLFDREIRKKYQGLTNEIEKVTATDPGSPPRAMCLHDAAALEPQHIFLRGNPERPGVDVPPQFPAVLAGPQRKPFHHGSGRLELAQAIASPSNPLTARVLVNRVWLHHFGAGLVRTPSDFGTRSDPPTHPELLDYLALRFIQDGWSIKALHRRILLSSVYQQASDDRADARAVDPENLLLWRMGRRRLDFEATRDSLLFVTGRLDPAIGGRPVAMTTEPYSLRRTVYGFIDRQNLPGLFRTFDFASPDTTSPQRFTTTVPQQSLFMMNSPFVIQQAQAIVRRPEVATESDPGRRIAQLYNILFDRAPSDEEARMGAHFVQAAPPDPPAWLFGYGAVEDGSGKVDFQSLPKFVGGSSWQGGARIPDPKLAFVSLTASGGHPGRDLQHAAIRRWVSPVDGSVSIAGQLRHLESHGDGVRGRVISSREGELASWNVFNTEVETQIKEIRVHKGDTIDFVVDCRQEDAHDSFQWTPIVRLIDSAATVAGSDGPPLWDAAADFLNASQHDSLGPWEKYVQVLLESNEFAFVD